MILWILGCGQHIPKHQGSRKVAPRYVHIFNFSIPLITALILPRYWHHCSVSADGGRRCGLPPRLEVIRQWGWACLIPILYGMEPAPACGACFHTCNFTHHFVFTIKRKVPLCHFWLVCGGTACEQDLTTGTSCLGRSGTRVKMLTTYLTTLLHSCHFWGQYWGLNWQSLWRQQWTVINSE